MVQFQKYHASSALLPEGWRDDVLITVDEKGYISNIAIDQSDEQAVSLTGPVIPGLGNVHSHAFQRAMAGLVEQATGNKDSFWTWRELMYQFLLQLTPEDFFAIAAQAYVEMLKAGFTTVGEFHYVHHQPNGKPYTEPSLIAQHLIEAAKIAGIAITLLPVLYCASGFGGQKPTEKQRRFITNETQLLDIITTLIARYRNDSQVTIGLAHHSLRAVPPEILQRVSNVIAPTLPIHIHIAEQMKEVEDCLVWSKQRPVEWLLNNIEVSPRWCLVHATHMTPDERKRLAHSGAVAGLCPTTEANLGDGLFPLPEYLHEQGRFAIGSDSNVSVSMIEELRLLEYGQRLLRRERTIAKTVADASVGSTLYTAALKGGSQALGRSTGAIAPGQRADFIALDPQSPVLVGKDKQHLLDALIFAGNRNPIRHVVAGGQQVVKDFMHVAEEQILQAFGRTMSRITSNQFSS